MFIYKGRGKLLFNIDKITYKGILKYPEIIISKGKTTFITGESGSGKSTLLKFLNGTISPDTGKIKYLNKDINSYDFLKLRREVLLVSQDVFLFDDSIKENFNKYYEYRNLKSPTEEVILKYLKICNANFPLNLKCSNMSGGERQRIYIAICLSLNPYTIMLDEPTSALDESTSETIIKNIKDYCNSKNITIIIVSHNRLLAEKYADEIIYLSGSKTNE